MICLDKAVIPDEAQRPALRRRSGTASGVRRPFLRAVPALAELGRDDAFQDGHQLKCAVTFEGRHHMTLTTDTDILSKAQAWRQDGKGVAIATVVETWGSAPRPTGSNLVIDEDGNFLGSVSGGCVEGAVVTEAMDVIASGKPRMLEFGVADETAWRVGLSCGGTIRVYVEKVD
jgi:hypothetical protein